MSTQQNKAHHLRFIDEAMSSGRLAIIAQLASPDLAVHCLRPGTPPGVEIMNQFFTSFRAAFPDAMVRVEDLIAEEDKIVARCILTGTHRGLYPNRLKNFLPPTGNRFSAEGIDIWRFNGSGKWVELWSVLDRLTMMQQLGAVRTGPSASKPSHPHLETEVKHGTS